MPAPERIPAEALEVDPRAPWWATLAKVLIVPIVGIIAAGWFDYRLRKQEGEHQTNAKQVQVAYDTITPAVRDLMTAVAQLTGRVDTLEKLVLALDHQADGSYPALNRYKQGLVNTLSRPMVAAPSQKVVPTSLDEAVKQSAR